MFLSSQTFSESPDGNRTQFTTAVEFLENTLIISQGEPLKSE